MMFERGISVSYEKIQVWCRKYDAEYARCLKRSGGPVGDTWHLDEVTQWIEGRNQHLWRAVDQEGEVINILVQSHRDSSAAERFFRKILKAERTLPSRVATDRLGSVGAAMRTTAQPVQIGGLSPTIPVHLFLPQQSLPQLPSQAECSELSAANS
jgi:putative transposase